MPFIPALRTQRQAVLCEFAASVVQTGNFPRMEKLGLASTFAPSEALQTQNPANTLDSRGSGLCVDVLMVCKISFATGNFL